MLVREAHEPLVPGRPAPGSFDAVEGGAGRIPARAVGDRCDDCRPESLPDLGLEPQTAVRASIAERLGHGRTDGSRRASGYRGDDRPRRQGEDAGASERESSCAPGSHHGRSDPERVPPAWHDG